MVALDTTGMKNEIAIHRTHRVNYGHSFRATGAELVEVGNMISADHALESATQEYVDTLMANAPLAMRAIKEVTVRGLNMRLDDRVRLAGIVNRRLQRTEDAVVCGEVGAGEFAF